MTYDQEQSDKEEGTIKDALLVAKTIYVDECIVKVLCPNECGAIYHVHGSCGGQNWQGSRVSHCDTKNNEYYVSKEIYSKDGKKVLDNCNAWESMED